MKYINFDIYVLSYYNVNNRFIKVLFKYITFIIDDLRIKIFIDINIFICENIDLIIFTRIDYIDNCYFLFDFNITSSVRFFIK